MTDFQTAADRFDFTILRVSRLVRASRYLRCCAERRRLACEFGAKCVNICALCRMDVVFSMGAAKVGVPSSEQGLCHDAICGYQLCYACRRGGARFSTLLAE